MALTYGSYLRLDELLDLQTPASEEEHDEMLFIVVHQVYELWFKEILHELRRLQVLLEEGDDARAGHTLKRVLTIMKVLVAQLDVLETMTPLEFLTFRDRLETGSGFQSHQFRAVEFMLGQKRRTMLNHFHKDTSGHKLLAQLWDRPTVWDSFLAYLVGEGYDVPASELERDVTEPVRESAAMQELLIDLYRNDMRNGELCERLIDLDEGVQEWRYRHVKMVERTIGTKRGTGGTDGVEYLRRTLFRPAFPDLWAVRSEF